MPVNIVHVAIKSLVINTRRNHTRINAEVTDQRSGGSRVDPGCGGNSPHPMANYLESKILVNVGYWQNVNFGSPTSSIRVIV